MEFTIENGDDGRTKAINVSGPGGAQPQVRPLFAGGTEFCALALSAAWSRDLAGQMLWSSGEDAALAL